MAPSQPSVPRVFIAIALAFALSMRAEAAKPKEPGTDLDRKAFFKPELSISTSHAPLGGMLPRLPNRAAWESLLAGRGDDPRRPPLKAWLDPRSGAATNLMGAFPLLPGRGVDNRVTLRDLAGKYFAVITLSIVKYHLSAVTSRCSYLRFWCVARHCDNSTNTGLHRR